MYLERSTLTPPGKAKLSPASRVGRRTLTLEDGRLVVRAGFDRALIVDMRKVRGWQFSARTSEWHFPLAARSALLRIAERHKIKVAKDVAAPPPPPPRAERPPRPRADVTEVTITARAGRLVASFPYDKALVAELRKIPGARPDRQRGGWAFPIDAGLELLRALERVDKAHVSDHAGELLAEARRMLAKVKESRALDAELEVPGLNGELRPFQRAGVRYATEAVRCIIGDEMGLGKTPQALAALQLTGSFPAIILVPALVKVNWVIEVNKWLPHLRVGALYGVPSNELAGIVAAWLHAGRCPHEDQLLRHFPVQPGRRIKIDVSARRDPMYVYRMISQLDVIVCNYDIIGPTIRNGEDIKRKRQLDHGWTPILKALNVRAVVGDESQYLMNPTTLRTRAAIEIRKTVDPDDLVLALSGSAVLNRRVEIASQLDFIGRLEEFGGAKAVKKMPDLSRRLRARCMVRRKKTGPGGVAPELPARQHTYVVLGREQLDQEVLRRYDKAERDLLAYLADEARRIAAELGEDPESAAVRARMKAHGAQYLIRINVLRRLAMQAKIPAAERWVREFMAGSDEKLLVFADHLEPLDLFTGRFGAPIIKGAVSAENRQRIVERFQTDPALRLVFLQIQAGGVGLTLTAASNVLFIEQAWSPLIHDQAIDRCYGRLNDMHGATGWYLLAEGTIDEWIRDLLVIKRIECTDALDGDMNQVDSEQFSVYGGLIEELTRRGLAA